MLEGVVVASFIVETCKTEYMMSRSNSTLQPGSSRYMYFTCSVVAVIVFCGHDRLQPSALLYCNLLYVVARGRRGA